MQNTTQASNATTGPYASLPSNPHHRRTTCRGCGDNRLRSFLSLGPTPLANSFLLSADDFDREPIFPLDVYYCETCALVQLLDVIDPDVLFQDYIYVTGTSDTIAAHNVRYARTVVDLQNLQSGDLVVEVASNDGSLLTCFKPYGVRILGVEPATNIAMMARAAGIETINKFFNSSTAKQIRESYGPAKVVIGNNVLAHVDDTRDFLLGCRDILDDGGVVVVEVPYLGDLLNNLEYDTIYHEHLCYFSISALLRLAEAVGLSIVRVDHVPIHGGSLRVWAARSAERPQHSSDVLAWADQERNQGLTNFKRYQRFAIDVMGNRKRLLDLLDAIRGEGKEVAGYGAPAKGNTLLNYCEIGTSLLPYTVDKNPMKVGRYTPGMHIPVLPVSTILERQPDYLLILAWNFADEIIRQQDEHRRRGGQFIVPIPDLRVV